AKYLRMDETRAEVGVSVADALQERGLGSILIGQLAQAASANGLSTFVAQVLPENHRMVSVFRESGFRPRVRALPGAIEVEFATRVTEEAIAEYEDRLAKAARNAIKTLLEPAVVAVIGASRDPDTLGGQ